MRKVIYSMGVSLGGFIEVPTESSTGPPPTRSSTGSGTIRRGRWVPPSTDRGCTSSWPRPTADTNPSAPGHVVEFARIWRDMPRIVFSTTLEEVDWNSRLVITPDGILMVPCRAKRGQSEWIQPFERKRSRCRSRTNLRRSGPTPPCCSRPTAWRSVGWPSWP
jgi:hypothetical protein